MAEPKKYSYLFGPVYSRRLGRSLGVDILPFKVCTLDCVYCQLASTVNRTVERKEYVPIEPVLAELKDRLDESQQADFITISGSGEPTLNSRLGELIEAIKKICDIPVAVLTNGTLFYRPDVRADCAKADVVMPSLDAGDEETFQRINRPCSDISIEKVVSGLSAFRKEFTGRIWLEVFLVKGANDDAGQIARIGQLIKRIRPDKIQLNTAVRPTVDPQIERLDVERLQAIAAQWGPNCEVIPDSFPSPHAKHIQRFGTNAENVLSMLKRRPCSLNDISSATGIPREQAEELMTYFRRHGLVAAENKNGRTFFRVVADPNL
ncbi:MAG: radical SAM protein [Planctomycetota bacterium]|jgi:wyosine [tRNA(Phe)-imidazoG37] synthetase (radical SAM superfamily)